MKIMDRNLEILERYVIEIVGPLVTLSEEFHVESKRDARGVLIEVRVSPEDVGRLLGKQGKTIGSVRHLVHNIGATLKEHVSVRVFDPNPEKRGAKSGGRMLEDSFLEV